MIRCPPKERLEGLLEETLDEAERESLSAHVDGCPSCQEALEQLTEAPVSLRGTLTAGNSTASLSAQLLSRLEGAPQARSTPEPRGELPGVAGYQILEELGRGGMGVVYRALHERLNRLVALKMILSGAHAGEADRRRFLQEAEAVAQLHHPNIVQIYDIGEADNHPFCALELVEGGSLVQYLRGMPQPAEASVRLLEILARTIHFAHERGIVHRDLKPANILLQELRPRKSAEETSEAVSSPTSTTLHAGLIPKITDFGLAKRLDKQDHNTWTGEVVGTPSYMAPEQAAGRSRLPTAIGPRADVYALGAILYECLTGHPPFKGATALDTVLQVLHEEPVRPARLRPDIPKDLETICLKCLEKSPSRRYGTALELADDLRRFRKGETVLARPVGPRERFWKWVRRRPTAASLAASIVLLVIVGFATVTWLWRATANARDEAMQANNRARAALYRGIITQSQLRWRLNDFTGARSSLKRFKLTPGQEDPRSWEWSYLEGLYASDLLTLRHNEGGTSGGLVVSPDGRQVASVLSGQRQVRVWSTEDGELLDTLPASPGAHRLAFRPDGGALAVADNTGGVTVWDLATRKRTDHHPHDRSIVGMAFSPDGKLLATASWDRTVKVWSTTGGWPWYELSYPDRAHCVAFSGRGEWLVTGDHEGQVRLYDAKTGTLLETLSGHKSAVYGVAFSPTGRRLASGGSNGNVRIWDLEPWQTSQRQKEKGKRKKEEGERSKPRVVQSLTGNTGAALGISYSPDGRYLAYGCSDATARVWYLSSGVLRVIFRGHTHPVEAVRFSPDGRRLYSCCPEQGSVKAWDLTRPPEYSTLARTRHPEYADQIPAGTLPEVKVWDLLRDSTGPSQASTGPDVEALAFQDEGRRLVSVTVGGRVQTWETASGMLLDEQPLPLTRELISPARIADFSPDGLRLAARRNLPGDEGRVVGIWQVWDTEQGKAANRSLVVLKGHHHPVFGVRFSADGRRLATFACDRDATGRPHEVKVWDAETGEFLNGWEGRGHLYSLTFSPNGHWLATGGEDGQVSVVEWATGKVILNRQEHKKAVTALAFSRDGKILASAGDQTVKVRDTKSWRVEERAIAEAPGLLCDLAFSADGKRMVGISRDVVKVWDVRTGQELLTLRGAPRRHRDPAFNPRLAFSPRGRHLAGSNWDESISVWEAKPPSQERQEARRQAARRRASLWHLQEAEHCLLAKTKNPFAARFHLKQMGGEPLSRPLRERKEHVDSWAAKLAEKREAKRLERASDE
jgi:WD40 repeat protein/serine/threonine protein kinase